MTVKGTNNTYTGSYVLSEAYYTTYEPTINVVIDPESPNTYPNQTSITMSIEGNTDPLNGTFYLYYGTWSTNIPAGGKSSFVTQSFDIKPGSATEFSVNYDPTNNSAGSDETTTKYWASTKTTKQYDVNKGTPTEDNLQFSLPVDTTYAYGTTQTASIIKKSADSLGTIGDITVRYGTAATGTSDTVMGSAITTAPTNAGTYYVWADIASNDYYNAAQIYCGSFTIEKRTPTITGIIKVNGQAVAEGAHINYGDTVTVEITAGNVGEDYAAKAALHTAAADEIVSDTVTNGKATMMWMAEPGNTTFTCYYALAATNDGNYAYKQTENITFTVDRIDPTVDGLYFKIPTTNTYNKNAQGIGEVDFKDDTFDGCNVTVKYALKAEDGTCGDKTATAPTNAGTYGVYVDITQGNNYNAKELFLGDYTIAKATQTITVSNQSELMATTYYYGDTVTIGATTNAADDNGTVTCTTTTPSSIEISDLNVTVIHTGAMTEAKITVSADATANYNAADDVVIDFDVSRKTPTVTLAITDANGNTIGDATYEDSITLTATVAKNGAGALPTGTITFILASSTGDGSDEIGTANLTQPDGTDKSIATLTVDATSANKFYATRYYITAKYTPDENTGYATADLTSGLFGIREKTISALTFGGTAQTYESGTAKTITVTAPNTLLTNDNFNVAYYAWDKATRTLTLENFSITMTGEETTAILLPYDSTVIVKGYNQLNTTIGIDVADDPDFVQTEDNTSGSCKLKIAGDGALNVPTTIHADALTVSDSATVYLGEMSSEKTAAPYLAVVDDAHLVVRTVVAISGPVTVQDNGTLEILGEDVRSAIGLYLIGDLTVSGGTLRIKSETIALMMINGALKLSDNYAILTPAGGKLLSTQMDGAGTVSSVVAADVDKLTFSFDMDTAQVDTNAVTELVIGATPATPVPGGGSTTITTTTQNPDGSTTTTVTNPSTGTVTETTERLDGSTTVVETKADGTATTTDKATNGVTVVTKTDKNGAATGATVTVPTAVKDPVQVEFPTDLGKTTGTVSVVVTYPDGTKETMTGTYTGGKVSLTVGGSATIEILDDFVPLAELPFTDVAAGSYCYDAVKWAVDQGVTEGFTDTTFGPGATCTRAQVVTFLWRAMGSPEPTTTVNPFTDVEVDAYYYKAVLWALEQGITKGATDTTFVPNATVTRAQAVTFLWRAAGEPAATATGTFADVSANAYYAHAVRWAAETGITTGTGAATFSPTNPCTRAQIVTFLYRRFGK